jgi:sulfotransferase 6B1
MNRRAFSLLLLIGLAHSLPTYTKIFTVSPMKSGAQLLITCISLLTGKTKHDASDMIHFKQQEIDDLKEEEFYVTHAPYTPEHMRMAVKNHLQGVGILRDPRDHILAAAHWIQSYPEVWPHLQKFSLKQLVVKLIKNYATFVKLPVQYSPKAIYRVYYLYTGWRFLPSVYFARFERLVGPQGGGNKRTQIQEVKNIAKHLGIAISHKKAQEVADKLFENNLNTYENQIGAGKQYLNKYPQLKKLFKQVAGHMLIDLGYEKDLNW